MVCLLLHALSSSGYCYDTVSLREYSILNTPVPSKIDLTRLPLGKTFQVNRLPQFTLQFFFNNRDIFGYIFKRSPKYGIRMHWCFFRSCDESPHDLNQIIARPQVPPFDEVFFSVKFPPLLQYNFQGLEFIPIQ